MTRIRKFSVAACLVVGVIALTAMALPAAAAVGRTVGSFGVTPTGSATYQIPIFTPRGPRGIQPSIAFQYDSSVRVGTLGRGWSLSGFSSIERCGKTVAQDGEASPVSLVTTDGYCIDGNRLRLVSGSYGLSGSVYATEIADFSRITASGAAGSGPAVFSVEQKSGLIYTYGNTADSRVLAAGTSTALRWMVNEIRDRFGNKVVFTYKAADATTYGTTHPVQVQWTQTSAGSGAYVYSMAFQYGSNTPSTSIYGYVSNSEVVDADLLTGVTVSVSGVVKRKYLLGYGTSPTTGGKRITSIQECSDSAATDCRSATTVTWQDGASGVSTGSVALSVSGNITNVNSRNDFNGDGVKDVAYFKAGAWYVRFGSTSGYSGEYATGAVGVALAAGDLLGDGRSQLVSQSGGSWYAYYWNGSSFVASSLGITTAASASEVTIADVDADGRADMIYATSFSGTTYVATTRPNTSVGGVVSFGSPVNSSTITVPNPATGDPSQMISAIPTAVRIYSGDSIYRTGYLPLFDVDRDGREDLFVHVEYQLCQYNPHDGTTFCFDPTVTAHDLRTLSAYQYQEAPSSGNAFRTDFNDDGCIDSAWGTGIVLAGCGGASAATIVAPDNIWGTVDWDGDGRGDVLVKPVSPAVYQVYLSSGNSLGAQVSSGISSTCELVTADANADGLDELGCLQYGSSLTLYYHNSGTVTPDLATAFTDGFGVSHAPTYTQISQEGHTPSLIATYPHKKASGSFPVVRRVWSSDGIGGTYSTTYTYQGATEHTQGLGFLGFENIEILDSRNGVRTKQEFALDYPRTGMVTTQSSYQPGGATISSRTVTPSVQTLDATANSQRYFVYPSALAENQYEVGGAKNTQLITQISESRSYDSWGNLTASSRAVTDKDSASPFYNHSWTTAASYTVTPDTGANWCLGIPSDLTTTQSTTTGEASVTRTQSFTVDYGNCRVTASSVEPSSSTRRVDTSYGFDAFGNIDSVSVTGRTAAGAAMAARTSGIDWGTTGQFPTIETNALSQDTTRTFSSTFGGLATETDPNGILVTSNQYDDWGRIQRSTRADGTSTVFVYANCATYGCQNGDPSSGGGLDRTIVHASERDTGDSQIRDSWRHYDAFDRLIVDNNQMMSGSYDRIGIQFDAMGREYRRTAPCDQFGGCSVYWITNAYDLLGRVTLQSRPQSASVSTPANATFTYAGRTQAITDPQSKVSTKIIDVNALMRQSIDHDGYLQVFGYNAAGDLTAVVDSLSNTLFSASYSHGISAFRDSTSDMDLGGSSYSYNSLGEMTSWQDAKSNSFSQTYDALSRVETRTEPEGTTTWTWGTSAGSHNIGRLAGVSMSGYSEALSYDGSGRLVNKTVTLDQAYALDITYNSQGAIDTLAYPVNPMTSRFVVKHGYQYGILGSVTDWSSGSAGTVYWTANAKNPRGQTTQETFGSGVVTNRAFDAVTGQMSSIQSGMSGGSGLQNESYLYDVVGNVTQRQQNNAGLTENFYYDNLYRLDYSQLNGSTNLDVSYSPDGNITSRSDISSGAAWTYHSTKKHAVTAAGSHSYAYDSNGNMTSRDGSTLGWTSYNYPQALATATESTTFYYGPDRQYYKQVLATPSWTETIHYLDGLFEKVAFSSNGNTEWRYFVWAEGKIVAAELRDSLFGNVLHGYPILDHLGSVAGILDSGGNQVVSESFDAFGQLRDGTDWSGPPSGWDLYLIELNSRRGFTGHTMVGQMGLIHMNGRVQDSVTGRFLSPDPYVTEPGNTQGFNRYSYVLNNPLSFIDPSGFASCSPYPITEAGVWLISTSDPRDRIWVGTPDGPSQRVIGYENGLCSDSGGRDPGRGGRGPGGSGRPSTAPGEEAQGPKTCGRAYAAIVGFGTRAIDSGAGVLGGHFPAFDTPREKEALQQFLNGGGKSFQLSAGEMGAIRSYLSQHPDRVGTMTPIGSRDLTRATIYMGASSQFDALLGTATGYFRNGRLESVSDTWDLDYKSGGRGSYSETYGYGPLVNAGTGAAGFFAEVGCEPSSFTVEGK